VADAQVGKAPALHRQGIPVPRAASAASPATRRPSGGESWLDGALRLGRLAVANDPDPAPGAHVLTNMCLRRR
jgi:hypothetical protein